MNRISDGCRIVLWSYVFIYVVICTLQITQLDTWWQLSEGFQILRTFHLPTQPVAAYGLPADPYFDEYAGYEVVLAGIYKATGFPGLWVIFIAINLAVFFLPSLYSKRAAVTLDLFSCLALLSACLLLKSRFAQRPEAVGTLLQVCLMVLLRKWRLEAINVRSLLTLFLLFVVWTNTHDSSLIGVFTLFLWVACEMVLKFKNESVGLLIKNGLLLAAVTLAALMINPYGPERLYFPFLQAFDPGSIVLSPEMWPITDIWSLYGAVVMIAMFLLAWAFLTSRTTPLWLILFSIVAVVMTFKSFRCISLLAVALLFVYAVRDDHLKPTISRVRLWNMLKDVTVCFLCIFMLFGDAFSFLFTYNEIRSARTFATHTTGFAPEVVDAGDFEPGKRFPILCGPDEGGYLSFEENTNFRPFLDSGMGHFSDDAKRYCFFAWHEPEAFRLALRDLDVDYAVINYHSYHWALEINRDPDWKLIGCSENGLLWQRIRGGDNLPSPSMREKIAASRDLVLQAGNIPMAFCYSTLLNQPSDSLAILSKFDSPDWPGAFFNYFSAWVDTLPKATIQDFLEHRDSKRDFIMDAVLWARLGPTQYAQFAQTMPAGINPFFRNVVEIRINLDSGNKEMARQIFDTIPTLQPSSVLYYTLWQKVRMGTSSANEDKLSAYGQWQSWDDSAKEFFNSTSTRLNNRIKELKEADAGSASIHGT